MVLLDLSNNGMLRQGECKNAYVSDDYNEKQLVQNGLELCVYMCINNEMQLMKNGCQSSIYEALGLDATEVKKGFIKDVGV